MKVIDYPDRDMLAVGLANTLAGELKNALLADERVSFVVPGGTSPGPIFDALCAADLDWERVTVFLSDERWVPEDHPRSNAALVRARLLVARAATARFVPFYAPETPPEAAVVDLERALATQVPVSVALLGMGADMHTASLFPGGEGLAEALDAHAPILVPQRVEGQPDLRVSLSAPVLNGALSKHLLIFGAEKRAALERALSLPPEEAPVNAVLGGMMVHWAE